jgi:hypothetical protein
MSIAALASSPHNSVIVRDGTLCYMRMTEQIA